MLVSATLSQPTNGRLPFYSTSLVFEYGLLKGNNHCGIVTNERVMLPGGVPNHNAKACFVARRYLPQYHGVTGLDHVQ